MRNIKKIILLFFVFAFAFSLSFGYGCNQEQVESGKLELSATQMELKVGETQTLSVKDASGKYTFTSSDSAVSVDKNGKITANSIGSACVTVSGKTGVGVCVVIVSGNMPVNLEKLEITSATETLQVGEVRELVFEKYPVNADNYNSIRWYSDNEEIATVTRDGVLTAKNPGTVTITVRASGTDKSAQFTLQVQARKSTVDLIYTDVTGIVGTSDLTLTANVFTDYTDISVGGYESENPSVATVNENGEVSFISEGKTVITYTVTCGGERLQASCKVAVIQKEGYTVIRTPEQLQKIGNISGNYMLGNDIDLQDACAEGGSLYYAGLGFSPLFNKKGEAFSGTFDGMGYAIKNLYINRPEAHFVALFGYINVNEGSEGLICNLSLEGGKIEGANYVSSFVAYHNGSGSVSAGIKNCWTDIEIVAHGKSCGGLVAYNGGIIENCYSLSKISGSGSICAISYNAVANAQLGAKNVFVCKDNQQNVQELVKSSNLNGTLLQASFKSMEEMKNSALYQEWDSSYWIIQDGSLPILKTANDR